MWLLCLCAVIETWMTPFQPEKMRDYTRLKWRHSCFYHATETRKQCFLFCFVFFVFCFLFFVFCFMFFVFCFLFFVFCFLFFVFCFLFFVFCFLFCKLFHILIITNMNWTTIYTITYIRLWQGNHDSFWPITVVQKILYLLIKEISSAWPYIKEKQSLKCLQSLFFRFVLLARWLRKEAI